MRTGIRHAHGNQQSKHSEWYRDMVPGMIPIVLLGSSVYLVCHGEACPLRGADFTVGITAYKSKVVA